MIVQRFERAILGHLVKRIREGIDQSAPGREHQGQLLIRSDARLKDHQGARVLIDETDRRNGVDHDSIRIARKDSLNGQAEVLKALGAVYTDKIMGYDLIGGAQLGCDGEIASGKFIRR